MVNRNLVIVRAGENSLHPHWIDQGSACDFDLIVAAYTKAAPTIEGPRIQNILLPGRKIQGYAELFKRQPDIFEQYDYIALVDDDIEATQGDFTRSFAIGRSESLEIWQPSLTGTSYFSHATFLQCRNLSRRYTNFIEMMCPFFSTRHLARVLPLFELGEETGIDLVWTRLIPDPWMKAAILDEVAVTHTRQVGKQKEMQGFRSDERYDEKMKQFLSRINEDHRGGISYSITTKSGYTSTNRLLIAFYLLSWYLYSRNSPLTLKAFLKLVSAAIKHTLIRQLDLGPLTSDLILDGKQS